MEYYHLKEKKTPNTPARNSGIYNLAKLHKRKQPDNTEQESTLRHN